MSSAKTNTGRAGERSRDPSIPGPGAARRSVTRAGEVFGERMSGRGVGRDSGVGRSGVKHRRVPELDDLRDAAALPVLDALHPAPLGIEPEGFGEGGGAAEAVDQISIGMQGVHAAVLVVGSAGLNTAFRPLSNATCNNATFKPGSFRGMADMHPTMKRLYKAAGELHRVQGQSDLARALNMSPQRINNWEARGISQEGAITAQAELGINSTWILTGDGEVSAASTPVRDNGWTDIRATTQGVALGAGVAPDEYAETHRLKFRFDSLRRKGLKAENLEVYYGRGDSMMPTVKDGDAVLIDRSETNIRDDKVYHIRYDGHYYVKRLQLHGDLVLIVSDNRDDPQWRKPVLVKPGDDFEVLGRVKWVGSWVD